MPAAKYPRLRSAETGGIIIAPVGHSAVQQLIAYEKKKDTIKEKFICDVRFVRVVGRHGFSES